jgi:hypothetical protein
LIILYPFLAVPSRVLSTWEGMDWKDSLVGGLYSLQLDDLGAPALAPFLNVLGTFSRRTADYSGVKQPLIDKDR